MRPADKYRLLHGPYTLQSLRKGDRATCLLRDGDVVITSWSDGRISWPRCRRLGHRGGSGLLVDDELVRAIRSESSLAIQFWFGISEEAAWRWRKAFGVEGPAGTEGSRRLLRAAADVRMAAMRGKKLPPDQVERRRRTARELDLGQYLALARARREGRWTRKELRLLGKMPDAELAEKTGRTANGVRIRRERLGIPKFGH
jgi:hypothetical protein